MARFTLVPATRLPSAIDAYTYSGVSSRPGYVDSLQGGVAPLEASGTVEVRLDGRPIQTRSGTTPNGPLAPVRQLVPGEGFSALVPYPADLAPGPTC